MLDLDAFKSDGFVKIEQAVPRSVADRSRGLLWQQLGLSPDDPSGWSAPVRWASDLTGQGHTMTWLAYSDPIRSNWRTWAGWSTTPAPGDPSRTPPGSPATCTSSIPSPTAPSPTAHAADEHRGRTPRFVAQSPVMLTSPLAAASSLALSCVWENR